MKLYFYGADKEVTGSCHLLEVNDKKILIDCGLKQGADEKQGNVLPFRASDIDAVLVTHAHIDHSGRLPLLVKDGFNGRIYATKLTCSLLNIMLLDTAHIQEADANWKSRKGRRAGEKEEEPLYRREDAEKTLNMLFPCKYGDSMELFEGITAEFIDSGHLLGSASIRFTLSEGGEKRRIVFSGDIGNKGQPIIKDPQYIKDADYVVMESTYGDRLHEGSEYTAMELAKVFDDTFQRGGNVIIPAFAVGRTQELLYQIREMKEKKLVESLPDFPVYVDSPLALDATHIYDGDLTGYADEETVEIIKKGYRPIIFSNLGLCRTAEESMALNTDATPKVIISSCGMCEAGRIRHHLKHNLWRKECSIVFVGYQAEGTLGRMLVDGLKKVKLFGEEIAVAAQICNFRKLSAHADKNGLIEWAGAFKTPIKKFFIVHGEEQAAKSLSNSLKEKGLNTFVPNYKTVYDLATDVCVDEGIERKMVQDQEKEYKKASPAYARLLRMGEQLMEVIKTKQGGANKDLAKFADQIRSLYEKWDK